MAFYFQTPIFAVQPPTFPALITPAVVATIASPLVFTTHWLPSFQYYTSPAIFPQPALQTAPKIKITVVFHGTQRRSHRPALFSISVGASYDSAPSREALLADVSSWARQHELEDRVHGCQVTLHLTRRATCPLVAASEDGAGLEPAAEDVVRTVALGERILGREFEGLMEEIRGGRHGAFLMVHIDAEAALRSGQQDSGSVGSREQEDAAPTPDPTPPELTTQLEQELPEVMENVGNEAAYS